MSKNTGTNKHKDDMIRQRWTYLKNQRGPFWRFFHISKHAKMVPNPLDDKLPPIPWVEKTGVTLRPGIDKPARHEVSEPRLPKDDFKIPHLTSLSRGVSYGLRR